MKSIKERESANPNFKKCSKRMSLKRVFYVLYLLFFAEIALQLFYLASNGAFLFERVAVSIYAPDEHSVWAVKPNLNYVHRTNEYRARYLTNSVGFRVPNEGMDYSLEPPRDVYRILLLGPSFAFGWGVDYEHSFAQQLEEKLNAANFAGNRRVQVINRGVPCLPPYNQFAWFKEVGKHYKPDCVILFQYGSLKMKPELNQSKVVRSDGYISSKSWSLKKQFTHRVKNFAIPFYLWSISAKVKHSAESTKVQGAGRELDFIKNFESTDGGVIASTDFYNKFSADVQSAGGELLVVYFPLAYCVHPQDIARWRHLGVKDVEAQVAYNQQFTEHLNAQGTRCLNIHHPLEEAARSNDRRIYYWLDIHWTPEGNAVAAKAVANHFLGAMDH